MLLGGTSNYQKSHHIRYISYLSNMSALSINGKSMKVKVSNSISHAFARNAVTDDLLQLKNY